MIADRQQLGLYFFIDHILEKDLKKAEDVTISFFSYLKRDFNNIYSLIDKDVSIKCVFNQEGIADYLAGSPDAVPFDDLDGKMKINHRISNQLN